VEEEEEEEGQALGPILHRPYPFFLPYRLP